MEYIVQTCKIVENPARLQRLGCSRPSWGLFLILDLQIRLIKHNLLSLVSTVLMAARGETRSEESREIDIEGQNLVRMSCNGRVAKVEKVTIDPLKKVCIQEHILAALVEVLHMVRTEKTAKNFPTAVTLTAMEETELTHIREVGNANMGKAAPVETVEAVEEPEEKAIIRRIKMTRKKRSLVKKPEPAVRELRENREEMAV